jgi:predicted phosphate transport protein (TIGR00153 family)
MFKFTPSNTKFYDHFDQASDVLVRAAEEFLDYLDQFDDPKRRAAEMKALEHEGDNITHATMELLDKSFITPLERGDIRRLMMALDDVLDFLDDAAQRIALYEIGTVLPDVRSLAEVLVSATKEVQGVVHKLRNLRQKNDILQQCIEIHRLEDEGDQIHQQALARLFKSGFDPLLVIKWKDIIEDVETSLDHCQDVANVVEGIVLENA